MSAQIGFVFLRPVVAPFGMCGRGSLFWGEKVQTRVVARVDKVDRMIARLERARTHEEEEERRRFQRDRRAAARRIAENNASKAREARMKREAHREPAPVKKQAPLSAAGLLALRTPFSVRPSSFREEKEGRRFGPWVGTTFEDALELAGSLFVGPFNVTSGGRSPVVYETPGLVPSYVWFIAAADRNRLQHALNGNIIMDYIVSKIWNYLRPVLGDTYKEEFEFEGDKYALNVSVDRLTRPDKVPVLQQTLPRTRKPWLLPGDVLGELLECRHLVLCNKCDHSDDDDEGAVYMFSAARVANPRRSGHELDLDSTDDPFVGNMFDLAVMAFPFLCPASMGENMQSCAMSTLATNGFVDYGRPWAAMGDNAPLRIPDASRPPRRECGHFPAVPVLAPIYTTDALGPFRVSPNYYRSEENCYGHRCEDCFPDRLHHWSPELQSWLLDQEQLPRLAHAALVTQWMLSVRRKWMEIGSPREVVVSGYTDQYKSHDLVDFPAPVIALVQHYGDAPTHHEVLTPLLGGTRSMGLMRVFAAFALPAGTVVYVMNGNPHTMLRPAPTDFLDEPWPQTREFFYGPCLHAARVVSGTIPITQGFRLSRVLAVADFYGVDEIVLNFVNWIVVQPTSVVSFTAAQSHRATSSWSFTLARRTASGTRYLHLDKPTRAETAIGVAAVTSSCVTSMTGLFDPKYEGSFVEVPDVRDFDAPRRLIDSGDYGAVPYDNVLVVVLYGTLGDTRPCLPIFRYLADRHFLVFVVRANTLEEGKWLLEGAETGLRLEHQAFHVDIANRLAAIPYKVAAPFYLWNVDIPISIEPPSWAIRPPVHSLSFANYILMQLFLRNRPVMRIGSWSDLDAVPRSTDGITFDVYYPGGRRPHEAVFVPGSSTTVVAPAGIPSLPAGDHLQLLRQYKVAYVVGAGTAQTAAAAGCRVVALSAEVDRNFVDRSNAGRGMAFGISPERVLSHIALSDPSLFVPMFGMMSWFGRIHLVALAFSRSWAHVANMILFVVRFVLVHPRQLTVAPTLEVSLLMIALRLKTTWWSLFVVWVCVPLAISTMRGLGLDVRRFVLWGLYQAFNYYLTIWFHIGISFGWGVPRSILLAWAVSHVPSVVSPIFAMLSPTSGCETYLVAKFHLVGFLPVVHTRFINHDGTLVGEGRFQGPVGAYVPYYFDVRPAEAEDDTYWTLTLPTTLPWSSVANARVPAARYSVWYNCQTMVLAVAGSAALQLGPGLILLIPMIIWMALSMFVYSTFLGFIWVACQVLEPLLVLEPSMIYVAAMHRIALVFTAYHAGGISWHEKVLHMVSVAQFSFGPSKLTPGQLEMVIEKSKELLGSDLDVAAVQLRTWAIHQFGFDMGPRVSRAYLQFARVVAHEAVVVEPEAPQPPAQGYTLDQVWVGDHITPDLYEVLSAAVDLTPGQTDELDDLLAKVQVILQFFEDPDMVLCHLGDVVDDNVVVIPWGRADDADVASIVEELSCPDERAERFLRWVFFSMPTLEGPPDESGEGLPSTYIKAAGEIVAIMVNAGFDEGDALEATALELAAYELGEAGGVQALEAALEIFTTYMEHRRDMVAVLDKTMAALYKVRSWSMANGMILWSPLELLAQLFFRVSTEALKGASVIASALVEAWPFPEATPDIREALIVLFCSFLDVLDVRHRQSPKPAWALLFGKPKYLLTRGEAMFATVAVAHYRPPASYPEWRDRMVELMRGAKGVDAAILQRAPPSRAVRMPRHTFGIKEYEQLIEHFNVTIHQTERETKMLRKAILFGGKPAIDQAWLATPASTTLSLSRYLVERPEPTLLGKGKIIEAADALFDQFPEMYENPRAMSVDSVIRATEWKYSAGLPFMPTVMKRRDLRNSEWINAIRLAASRILEKGEFPGIAFHCFPKTQLVALDSLIDKKKPIRTVTAGDRITAIAYNCLAMERNKRPPPHRALVLPAFSRTEGGMAPVIAAMNARDAFLTGDGTQFDSTVVSELVVEGPVRLWERGVAGNIGASATSTFMRAYYEAIASGVMVNLMTGEAFTKNGGGGTGSAATSVDNRDWTRIALIASWSIAMDLPCTDFFKHVTLANASDDVALAVDKSTLSKLMLWKTVLKVEYGVDFTFEAHNVVTDILHLKVVPDPDMDMYHEVGVDPPAVSYSHDVTRLFTMRSEYRSDKVRHRELVVYDAIASRSIGHLYLSAHNPEAYSAIIEDWEDAVVAFMLTFFKQVEVQRLTGDDGTVRGCTILTSSNLPSEWLLRLARRFNPADHDDYIDKQQRFAKRWHAAHRAPTYSTVFYLWVKPPPEITAQMSRYRKLPIFLNPSPWMDYVRLGLNVVMNDIRLIPRAYKSIGGELEVFQVYNPYTKNDFIVEQYIWIRALDRLGRVPTKGEFLALIRQSPYSSMCDPIGFLTVQNSSSATEMLMDTKDGARGVLMLKIWIIHIVYGLGDAFLRRLVKTPFIGFWLVLGLFFLRDMDVVYSLLSLVYWTATGTASVAISNLGVRDQYLVLKIFASVVTASLPIGDYFPDWLYVITGWLAYPVDWATASVRTKLAIPSAVQVALALPVNDMSRAARQCLLVYHEQSLLLEAGMGSGKSSVFIAALRAESLRTIWLVMPTNLLVESYRNDFLLPDCVMKLSTTTGIPDMIPTGTVIVITAGLFSELVRSVGRGPTPDELGNWMGAPVHNSDLIVIDEIGLGLQEQAIIMAVAAEHNNKVIGLSGTPIAPLCSSVSRKVVVPTPARFTIQRIDTDDLSTRNDAERLANTVSVFLKHRPEERMMTVVASLSTAEKLAQTLTLAGRGASVVSRMDPIPAERGDLICTTIADLGVDFRPPPGVLIDQGYTIAQLPATEDVYGHDNARHTAKDTEALWREPYHSVAFWTSPALCGQRHRRVGRRADGVVYAPKAAGTGPQLYPLLNPGRLMSLPSHRIDEVCRLLDIPWPFSRQRDTGLPTDYIHVSPLVSRLGNDRVSLVDHVKVLYVLVCEMGGMKALIDGFVARDPLLHKRHEQLARQCGLPAFGNVDEALSAYDVWRYCGLRYENVYRRRALPIHDCIKNVFLVV